MDNLDELIARLRKNSRWRNEIWQCITDPALLVEAADALTALKAERDALEAGIEAIANAEPVAWQRRQQYSDIPGYVPQWQFVSKEEATDHFEKRPGYEYRPVYAHPPREALQQKDRDDG